MYGLTIPTRTLGLNWNALDTSHLPEKGMPQLSSAMLCTFLVAEPKRERILAISPPSGLHRADGTLSRTWALALARDLDTA